MCVSLCVYIFKSKFAFYLVVLAHVGLCDFEVIVLKANELQRNTQC